MIVTQDTLLSYGDNSSNDYVMKALRLSSILFYRDHKASHHSMGHQQGKMEVPNPILLMGEKLGLNADRHGKI